MNCVRFLLVALATGFGIVRPVAFGDEPETDSPSWSGIYPHLTFFNNERECGTGAVVPWAGRLWVVTYAPHAPLGSSDKLYEIDENLNLTVRPESIGGTPANRMIHSESDQLFIGPYAIDGKRTVRVIPYAEMFGRPTGTARHLTDPVGKVYTATMEEGLYEIDVKTLAVTPLYYDEADRGKEPKADLPGYHGKGLYTGQGRLIYANNGEHGAAARKNPFVPSGVLAEWDGDAWEIVLRNQFTEVTGPGGIRGAENPETDPVWAVGWDARSLILMVLDGGEWHRFRLPKASHSYDGAHGWNTEWPRIREIGDSELLMTMHGMFWRFPKTFSRSNTAGIDARSTYLKVIGDFCAWREHVVFGCDDTANAEFLNKRRAKGEIAAPQSQSNLWFVKPDRLDDLGPVIGRGAVWLNDDIPADRPSDPYLFSGSKFDYRSLHLTHRGEQPVTVQLEIDRTGNGTWEPLIEISLNARESLWREFASNDRGVWVRLRSDSPLTGVTAWFDYRERGRDASNQPKLFDGLLTENSSEGIGGVIRARGGNKRTLHFAAIESGESGGLEDVGLYVLDEKLNLNRVDDPQQHTWLKANAAIPDRTGVISLDAASVIYTDDAGRRWRLPRSNAAFDEPSPLGWGRLDREVATERDLFNCHGTFYELPAENAGGFARVRPVTTHGLRISDYCSYRGLLVLSGVDPSAADTNRHVIRSDDGRAALWVGAIDDIWQLGKPIGYGGPWRETTVEADAVSDPYLMTGYDSKTLELSVTDPTTITVELDITGRGDWVSYRSYPLDRDGTVTERLPNALSAYWVRFRSSAATRATAMLRYE